MYLIRVCVWVFYVAVCGCSTWLCVDRPMLGALMHRLQCPHVDQDLRLLAGMAKPASVTVCEDSHVSPGMEGTLSSPDLAGKLFPVVPAGLLLPVGPVGPVGCIARYGGDVVLSRPCREAISGRTCWVIAPSGSCWHCWLV